MPEVKILPITPMHIFHAFKLCIPLSIEALTICTFYSLNVEPAVDVNITWQLQHVNQK